MAETQNHLQLFLLWLLPTIVLAVILSKTRQKPRRPPGPPWLPVIGHLHLITPLTHQSFHALSTRYGPIMQLFLGSLPCIVVSSPDIAKLFFHTHQHTFSNRFVSTAVHHLSYGGKGFLFAPYGTMWKFMKKISMSELLGSRTLDQLRHVREQETIRFMRMLKAKGEARASVNVGGELLTLTNNVISRMVMGGTYYESDSDMEDVKKMVEDTAEFAGRFNVADFVWFCKGLDLQRMKKRIREIVERFDCMIERVIKEHEERRRNENGEQGEKTKDLLDILLEIHEDESREVKLTRENIKAFILDIFMAGTETSAKTMEWALAELINNPHVMEKARQEINSVTRNKRIIQESDLGNLPYLQAIVKETLRIHPTSPLVGRQSSQSCNVSGYDIPEKTLLFVNLWSMGRDPKLWEKPLEFRPERFLGEEEKRFDMRGQNFQLMPFGTGIRLCPGASLALQVVPTNLAAMIQCFEWKVNGEVSMEEKPALTLPRAHPLICVPVPLFSFSL